MAALAGGAFLSAFLQVLFDRLASREVLNFLRGRRTVEAKLKELRRKLLVLDTVLDDAEAKYIRKEAVKKWLDDLKDAVYDAEDLVEEINYQALRCKVEHDYQGCPNQQFPEGGLPSNLRTLEIGNCKKLAARRREWGIQTLPSLQDFGIWGEEELQSFPDEELLPSSLRKLEIRSLPNFRLLNDRGLQPLGSLEVLIIEDCPQLQSLPREGLPNSIRERRITNCPLLESHR